MSIIAEPPEPRYVMATDGVRIATYDVGDPDDPAVLAVHGFASSAAANWFATGWVRELVRAGYRVVAVDQRGHGRSGKPHDAAAYSMVQLVADVATVLDAYLIDEAAIVGYSLGARVGWHASLGSEHRITRAVLGGIPDGRPLTRFRIAEARAHVDDGAPLDDRLTRAYVDMARRSPDNDLGALIALVEGQQDGLQPDPLEPPRQPVLFATGSEDGIIEASRRLAAATPLAEFLEIPGRNHFNAPTAREFRDGAIRFLGAPVRQPAPRRDTTGATIDLRTAGIAALLLSEADLADRPAAEAELDRRWAEWMRAVERARRLTGTRPS